MKRKLSNEELGRLDTESFKRSDKFPVVVVLDEVRSLNNVGSVFRTCDAFRIERLLLCGLTGTPPNREIEKTALGATQTVAWQHVDSTTEAVKALKQENYKVFAVEQAENSASLRSFAWDGGPLALVFGNEVYGVAQDVIDLCDDVVEIPQAGTKHSLNIAVSVGVVLWEVVRGKI